MGQSQLMRLEQSADYDPCCTVAPGHQTSAPCSFVVAMFSDSLKLPSPSTHNPSNENSHLPLQMLLCPDLENPWLFIRIRVHQSPRGKKIEVPVSRAFLGEQEGFFFRKVYLLLTRDGVLVFQPGKDPPPQEPNETSKKKEVCKKGREWKHMACFSQINDENCVSLQLVVRKMTMG